MNSDESKKYWFFPPYEASSLIYYVRCFSGLNQAEMAHLLSTTQSWLSKMEQGVGEVRFTLDQWKALKDHLDISIDHLILGQAPFKKVIKNSRTNSVLPFNYAQSCNTVVKITYPVLMLMVDVIGKKETLSVLKKLRLEDFHFVEPSLPANSEMLLDMFNLAINLGILTEDPKSIDIMIRHALRPQVFGLQFNKLQNEDDDIPTSFKKFLNMIYIQNGLEDVIDHCIPDAELRLSLIRPHGKRDVSENLTTIFAKYSSKLFFEINNGVKINFQVPFKEILIYEFA